MSRKRNIIATGFAAAALALASAFAFVGVAGADEPARPVSEFSEQELRHALTTERDTALFWSGQVDGESVHDLADTIASETGRVTLGQRMAARGIAEPGDDMDAWARLSRYMADGASGRVAVLIGTTVREGNIWETVEFPALQANPAVDEIVRVDPITREDSVLWERGGGGEEPPAENRHEQIRLADTTKCLDLANHRESYFEADVVLSDCNASANQTWIRQDNGYLQSVGSLLCLDWHNDDDLRVNHCGDVVSDQWTHNGDTGELENDSEGGCLDAPNGNHDNGTQPIVFGCQNSNNQRWIIEVPQVVTTPPHDEL